MESGSVIQVCVCCQPFEITVPGMEWGDSDPVTSGTHGLFQLDSGCEDGSAHTGLLFQVAVAWDSGHSSTESLVSSY